MRAPNRLAIAALAGAWVLTMHGCGHPARVSGAAMVAVAPAAGDTMASRFPGAASVLSGVEVARKNEFWSTGDRVLLGLTFERGGARTERMLLVELAAEPGRRERYRRSVGVFGDSVEIDSPTRATRLRVFDERGGLVSQSEGQVAEIFLQHGPWEVARIGGGYAIATGGGSEAPENPRPEVTLEQLRPGVYGMMSLLAFGEGAGENAVLAGLIERAFTMGQKLGLLFSMGQFEIRIGAVTPIAADAPARDGLGGLECYDCQVLVSVSGKLALSGRAVLAPSVPPLGTCGGIVLADLTNAADPDIRVGVVLLASELGSELGSEAPNSAGIPANPGG